MEQSSSVTNDWLRSDTLHPTIVGNLRLITFRYSPLIHGLTSTADHALIVSLIMWVIHGWSRFDTFHSSVVGNSPLITPRYFSKFIMSIIHCWSRSDTLHSTIVDNQRLITLRYSPLNHRRKPATDHAPILFTHSLSDIHNWACSDSLHSSCR